jgi:transcriptional regulator
MYLPRHFEQNDRAALATLMCEQPLATLVTQQDGALCADHLPLLLETGDGDGEWGTLRGHVARANPLWKKASGSAVMAVFTGVEAYISPSWYPSKATTHKVVPTWNYAAVHAHGTLRAVEDRDWLLALVSRLTGTHEAARAAPWAVSDAPADYVEQMLRAIVGIEIPLTRLEGKWKLSQNRDVADRRGVATGLAAEAKAAARAMSAQIEG